MAGESTDCTSHLQPNIETLAVSLPFQMAAKLLRGRTKCAGSTSRTGCRCCHSRECWNTLHMCHRRRTPVQAMTDTAWEVHPELASTHVLGVTSCNCEVSLHSCHLNRDNSGLYPDVEPRLQDLRFLPSACSSQKIAGIGEEWRGTTTRVVLYWYRSMEYPGTRCWCLTLVVVKVLVKLSALESARTEAAPEFDAEPMFIICSRNTAEVRLVSQIKATLSVRLPKSRGRYW